MDGIKSANVLNLKITNNIHNNSEFYIIVMPVISERYDDKTKPRVVFFYKLFNLSKM